MHTHTFTHKHIKKYTFVPKLLLHKRKSFNSHTYTSLHIHKNELVHSHANKNIAPTRLHAHVHVHLHISMIVRAHLRVHMHLNISTMHTYKITLVIITYKHTWTFAHSHSDCTGIFPWKSISAHAILTSIVTRFGTYKFETPFPQWYTMHPMPQCQLVNLGIQHCCFE